MDWDTLTQVKRDICYLLHEQAEMPGIDGDLDYRFYRLPYWEYLGAEFDYAADRTFVVNGCLLMVLTMAWDLVDRSGNYLRPLLEECVGRVSALDAGDPDTTRLKETVLLALETAREGSAASAELEAASLWANRRFVLGYFRSTAAALEKMYERCGADVDGPARRSD
jgi:hypothetical protein